MSEPVNFDTLLVALQESVAEARKALRSASHSDWKQQLSAGNEANGSNAEADDIVAAKVVLAEAIRGRGPQIEELTLNIEGTLYESPAGLGLRLGRRRMWRRRARQRLQIRLHGEPIVTEVSIDGHSLHSAAEAPQTLEKDDETHA